MTADDSILVIEAGFTALEKVLEEKHAISEEMLTTLSGKAAGLLARMGALASPMVPKLGLEMLKAGVQDGTGGEVFSAEYFPSRMLILGKTDPVPFRPDNPGKKVTDQFCVLAEDGKFYEVMYTVNSGRVDAYQAPIEPEVIMDVYGYEIMFMLYRALRDFSGAEDELISAFGKVLDFMEAKERKGGLTSI